MQPFLTSARRYRWPLAAILVVVWGAGLVSAFVEYKTTYEAKATIWVLKAAADLAAPNPDDPSVPLIQTAAVQHSDLLKQLLQTRSFVRDVIAKTSERDALATTANETALLDDISKRFKVDTIGPNMLTVTFAGRDPQVATEMVKAALDVRLDRLVKARIEGTTALSALYQRDYELAQARVVESQRLLEEFNLTHPAPLSELDQHQQAQLRLTLNLAQVRVSDLQGRMDRSVLAPALLEISGIEFQVVDAPHADASPKGGTKPALMISLVALGAGAALAALLIMVGALLANHVTGPADVGRLAPAKLFASVPRVAVGGQPGAELRTALAAIAFGDAERGRSGERA